MEKIIFNLALLLIITNQLFAYPFKIEGTVTDSSGNPVHHQSVWFYSLSLQNSVKKETNNFGKYVEEFIIPAGYFPKFYVQIWTVCNGVNTSYIEECTAFHGTVTIDFTVCGQDPSIHSHIPDFQIEKINNLNYGFINTSFGITDSVSWDFSTDTILNDFNPIIDFPEKGIYKICLKIFHNNTLEGIKCKQIPIGDFESANGFVEMNGLGLENGYVYLYQKHFSGFTWILKNEVSNGLFHLPYVFYNKFFLQAVPEFDINYPYYPKYLPSYYSESLYWNEADSIEFSSPLPNFNINLISYDEMFYGEGSISGKVNRHDTVDYSIAPPWITNSIIPPLSIFLISETGDAMDFRILESSSEFAFSEIPIGRYTIKTDIYGYNTIEINFELTSEKPEKEISEINIYQNDIILSKQEITINNQLEIEVFPNPAKEKLFIKSNQLISEIRIFNANSDLVFTHKATGKNSLSIDLKNYIPGVYILEIIDNSKNVYQERLIFSAN